jgi:hypothetical protein
MGNSKGSYQSTLKNSMAAYDRLPPTARLALQNAVFAWAPQPIRTKHNRGVKGYRTGAEIATTIATWDKAKIKKDQQRVWRIK